MTSRLNPYLSFDGNAREAMEFYKGVFGGELNINTFGEYGVEGESGGGVMHAQLEGPHDFCLMASDPAPGTGMGATPNGTVSLSGDDEAELRGWWDKLSEGGNVTMPLEKQMWGDIFGMCTDKFGVAWMVDIVEQAH